jgi:putative acetyltransferase
MLGFPEGAVLISRFRTGEEHALFDVFYSAIHLIASRDYTAEQINAWAPPDLDQSLWAKRIRGINPLVAELDGSLVGYADVQASGYIDHFFVSGHHPSQGIGRRLMTTLHKEATSLELTELTADVSRTAQPFFARFGVSVIEQRTPELRGVVVPNALMRKPLP